MARLLVLVAEVDGAIVACARAELQTWTTEVGAAALSLIVHPDHRRRGIAERLYDLVEHHLREHDAKRVEAWATDDPAADRWCARRGYQATHEIRFSRLDLTDIGALPPMPTMPAAVRVASFAETGPEPVYPVDAASVVDEPGDVIADAVSYDQWLTDVWQTPDTDLQASTLVLVDDVPAAYTHVEVDHGAARMWSGGTGTLREYRGRGVAKLAKSVALRQAAQTGITAAYTSNDGANRPMLAVNDWLGYRPCGVQRSYIKVL